MVVVSPNTDPPTLDSVGHLYVRPCGIIHGHKAKAAIDAGRGLPLAGHGAFTSCQVIKRRGKVVRVENVMTVEAFFRWRQGISSVCNSRIQGLLADIGRERVSIAGTSFCEPVIAGVVNVTPDSFSGDKESVSANQAIEHGCELFREGASFIDVGGESTRPGAARVSSELEQNRVIPVIRALVADGIPVSIDTYHPETMLVAVANGASIINDVSALTYQVDSARVAASADTAVVLVHSQKSHVTEPDPTYGRVAIDIYDSLAQRVKAACASGIPREKIIVDPGLGFAKTSACNFQVLDWLGLYHGLGCPLMLGASRKFGRLVSEGPSKGRLGGSIASAVYAVDQGIQVIRAHDVRETVQALGVQRAIRDASN